jgi:transcriptional regulator with XRE-family HTH domain
MNEELQEEICARIKLARTEAGMTLEEMADALGVTQRAYWNYENNRVPFRRMTEIAEITGKSQDWLYRGDPPPSALPAGLLKAVADGVEQLERSAEDVLGRLDETLARLARIEDALLPPGETHQGQQP